MIREMGLLLTQSEPVPIDIRGNEISWNYIPAVSIAASQPNLGVFPVLRDNGMFLNELNTLPGFTSISMYPKLWEISGVPLTELVGRLVDGAVARHRDRRRLDDGIKGWLARLTS